MILDDAVAVFESCGADEGGVKIVMEGNAKALPRQLVFDDGVEGLLVEGGVYGDIDRVVDGVAGGGVGVAKMVPASVGGVGNNIEGVGLGVEEAVGACELEVVDALALKGEEHCVAETVVLVHVEIHIAFVEGIVGEDGVGAAAEGVDVEHQFGESERGWVAEPVLAILPIEVCAIIGGVVPVARPERDGHGVAR